MLKVNYIYLDDNIKLHPELLMRKDMIFSMIDPKKRTKVVCTIGL